VWDATSVNAILLQHAEHDSNAHTTMVRFPFGEKSQPLMHHSGATAVAARKFMLAITPQSGDPTNPGQGG
jgi:hypothetical protein